MKCDEEETASVKESTNSNFDTIPIDVCEHELPQRAFDWV